MADGSAASTREQITRLVEGLLAKRGVPSPPSPLADLRRSGLTSLDMVNLLLAIEDEFEIEIAQPELKLANFRSIDAIDGFVRELTRA